MARYILSINQRTAGTHAGVFDHEARVVSSAYGDLPLYSPQPGWVEYDANEIWDVTLKVIAEAFRNGRIAPEDIDAIGIANQRMTTVFWNKRTGEPVGRAIGWQDQRTLPLCEYLISQDRAGIEDRTGMLIIPDVSATTIRWVMDHDKAVQKAAARRELLCGTVDSWLIWKLSGGALHVSDYSNASLTLLLNARSLTYDSGMLGRLAIPREVLPDLRSSSEVYAYTAPEAFFDVRVPIAAAVGNQQAGAFGQACFEPGSVKSTYGSGSFLTLNTGGNYQPPVSGIFSPVLWAFGEHVTYGLEGKADVSGTAIQWLQNGLGLIREAGEAEGLASQVPDTGGVYFVPAFLGLGAPHYDRNARGTMLGITRGTTRHHVVRAALEAIAYQTRDGFEIMRRESGFDLKRLRVDGSGAKSDFLMQFQADILGVPIERPVLTEAALVGAAYLAGLAVGYWQSTEELATYWRLDCRFEPRITAARRAELYDGWQRAIRHTANWLKD